MVDKALTLVNEPQKPLEQTAQEAQEYLKNTQKKAKTMALESIKQFNGATEIQEDN